MVSLRVRKRFPTMEHVVKAGLITEAEAKLMEKPNAGYSGNKWWMPLVWATKIVDMVRNDSLAPSISKCRERRQIVKLILLFFDSFPCLSSCSTAHIDLWNHLKTF